jgi:hypothetical protein
MEEEENGREILSLIQSRQLLGKLTHHGAASNGTRPLNFLCVAYQLPYVTLLINITSLLMMLTPISQLGVSVNTPDLLSAI